ncbi:MAG: PASTA domain-containing protein [Gammaproteobacteria bacterium]|nr:PASTA domain-containing protein [Gammaproteobacteria bacterium]
MYSRIALVLVTLIFICSCNSDSDSSRPIDSENNVSFAMPKARDLAQLPQAGSWRAYIIIPEARNLNCGTSFFESPSCDLSVNTAAEEASGRIDLEAGTYTIEIVWLYGDPDFFNSSRTGGEWLIANAQKSVTIIAGQTSSLAFNENDYKPLPDEDDDGVSNLAELEQRTDPGNSDDPPTDIAVPDVVGLFESEARSQIETAGLLVGAVTEEHSESVEANRIISQIPSGGVLAKAGATVALVISLGPDTSTVVPDCRQIKEADCKERIRDAGLKVGKVTREFSDTIPKGDVIRTIPAHDTMVDEGSTVKLVVSRGLPDVPVPDCRNVPEADCKDRIRDDGLKVGKVTREFSDTIPKGDVIRTDPAHDTMVDQGSTVDIVVSKDPPPPPTHKIENIVFSPVSPASLNNEQRVNITFNYRTDEPGGVRIFALPFTSGAGTSNFAVCGSPLYPTGEGSGDCFFRVSTGTVKVDQVRFRMTTADQSSQLLEFFVDVDYQYGPTGLSVSCRNLLVGETCGTSTFKCVSLRIGDGSTCGENCAQKVSTLLTREGINFGGRFSGGTSNSPACVGWREDIGGTRDGAVCLQSLLGSPYQVENRVTTFCRSDGFPYSIIVE